jgi:hypothetical protein
MRLPYLVSLEELPRVEETRTASEGIVHRWSLVTATRLPVNLATSNRRLTAPLHSAYTESSMSLRSNIQSLAATFADSVLAAIRGASLEDLLAESGVGPPRGPGRPRKSATTSAPSSSRRSSGRLARRSPEQIAKALDQVVALVKGKKDGLRAEQIRAALKMESKEMPRVLKEGLAKRKLKAKGQKRATTYFAA